MNGKKVRDTVLSPTTSLIVFSPTTTLCSNVETIFLPTRCCPTLFTPLLFQLLTPAQPPKILRLKMLPNPTRGMNVPNGEPQAKALAKLEKPLRFAVPSARLPSLNTPRSSSAVLLIILAGLYFVSCHSSDVGERIILPSFVITANGFTFSVPVIRV